MVVQLVTLQAFGAFGGGSPTELSPSPMPLALLWFLLPGSVAMIILAMPAVAFLGWMFLVRTEADRMPRRSVGLFIAFGALSLAWYIVGTAWAYYDWRLLAIDAALIAATVTAVLLARSRPSMAKVIIAHTLFFSWLGSYAFPWVGEVP